MEYERVLTARLMNGERVEDLDRPPQGAAAPAPAPAAAPGAPASSAPTVYEFAPRWLDDYVAVNLKPATLRGYRSIFAVHLGLNFGDQRLDEITRLDLERYKGKKLRQGLKKKTINNQLQVLSSMLHTAVDWGVLEAVPVFKWLSVEPPSFDHFTVEESERLLAAATPGQDRTMIKSRQIPMTSDLVAALRAHRHLRGPFVFCLEDGSPLHRTHRAPRRLVPAACRRAGLRQRNWHTLRHSFASQMVAAGVPIRAVQELLGHADIEVTMRYAHLSPSVLTDAVAVLDPETRSTVTRWSHGPGESQG